MNVKRKSIKSDLKKLDRMKDKEIDYSDIPSLDDSFFVRKLVSFQKKPIPKDKVINPQ